MSGRGGGAQFTGGAPKNGPIKITKSLGKTPAPAGKPKGGKALADNPNLKGGSGNW